MFLSSGWEFGKASLVTRCSGSTVVLYLCCTPSISSHDSRCQMLEHWATIALPQALISSLHICYPTIVTYCVKRLANCTKCCEQEKVRNVNKACLLLSVFLFKNIKMKPLFGISTFCFQINITGILAQNQGFSRVMVRRDQPVKPNRW